MKKIMIASLLALFAGSASAATVSFDLSGNATAKTSLQSSVAGVELTLSGVKCADNESPNGSSCVSVNLDQYSGGLGIKAGMMDSRWGDQHTVDGFRGNEFVKLAFNKKVKLQSVSFTYFGFNDKFVLYSWDGSEWDFHGVGDACKDVCLGGPQVETYDFVNNHFGSTFSIGATGSNDNWKLAGVTVAAVPVPAAGWLLLAGLGGIAALKRRRKAV